MKLLQENCVFNRIISEREDMNMKKLFLIGMLILTLTACSQTEDSLEKIKITAQAKETEISERTEIKVETTPEDYELDKENFIVSKNGKITKKNNKYYFSASKKGTYKIQYKDQDGSSNTLTIKVVEPEETKKDETNNNTSTNNNSEANAATNAQSTPQNAPSSVDKIIEYGNSYISTQQEVWVQGNIPQALLQDANGNMVAVMYNDSNSQYIILDGQVNINSSRAVATGTLSFNGTNYVLHLTSINPM